MSADSVIVRAPSNIAWVKYMGKKDSIINLPSNPSLSMTLNSLSTRVWFKRVSEGFSKIEFKTRETFFDSQPSSLSEGTEWESPVLSAKAQQRVIDFGERLEKLAGPFFEEWNLERENFSNSFWFYSENNFPQGSGIASSASSFAAITTGFLLMLCRDPKEFEKKFKTETLFRSAVASLSRQGSGSSIRSFDGPFVCWQEDLAQPIETNLPELSHFVLLFSSGHKEVGSSEAHSRVPSSPLWLGRESRAIQRVEDFRLAIKKGDWNRLAREVWNEAWEMHSMFHTSLPPFTYWKPQTVDFLNWMVTEMGSSDETLIPVVTMDAGPNVHVTVPRQAEKEWFEILSNRFPDTKILKDSAGSGVVIESICKV